MDISRKHLLYGIITFVSLLAAIAKLTYFNGLERGPQTLLFVMMYVVFLIGAVGKLRAVQAQEEEEKELFPGAADFFDSDENRPSEETLISAETYLSMGESLETICRFVDPRYMDWTPAERLRYRQGLRAALDQRRGPEQAPEQAPELGSEQGADG